MEQLFVIPASKLMGQQALQALMLLVGSACVLPSSLLQLTCVVHLIASVAWQIAVSYVDPDTLSLS